MERKQTHMMYGFIIGILMVVLNAVMIVTKMNLDPKLQYVGFIGYAIFLVGLILNAGAYSKANGANITFGQAFGSCFKASAIVAILVTVWAIAATYIFPNMVPDMIEMARQKMIAQGKISEEQIDMAMDITRKSFKLFMIAGAVFGTMVMGALFSLIAAATAKKNPHPVIPG